MYECEDWLPAADRKKMADDGQSAARVEEKSGFSQL